MAADPDAWVDAHGDYLYRFAVRRVGRADVAEELVQDALVAALAARHAFAGRASERTWLTAILRRKVADWLRHQVRVAARTEPLPDDPADALFTASGKWRGPPPDPGREVDRAEARAALAGCLDALPPRLRQVVVLRYLDEESAAAVCQAADVTATNLWVMLHRARLRLWRCLADRGFADPPPAPRGG